MLFQQYILYAWDIQNSDRAIKHEPDFPELKAFHTILHQQTYNDVIS
jgi:hypothetical protein